MKDNVDSLFSSDIVAQVPVFYSFFSELETEQVGELKVTAKFSSSRRHQSDSYLSFPMHKPISTINSSALDKEYEAK